MSGGLRPLLEPHIVHRLMSSNWTPITDLILGSLVASRLLLVTAGSDFITENISFFIMENILVENVTAWLDIR